ncbi:MAG: Nucleolar GTP-binding protein 2 [Paramarteilia canceri]
MYKNSKPFRNKEGKITKEAPFQSKVKSGSNVRIEPNIRWFSNTRVVTQTALDKFRTEIGAAVKDPFRFITKPSLQPLSLLDNRSKQERSHILDTESYAETCNLKNQTQKRVKHAHSSIEDIVADSQSRLQLFDAKYVLENTHISSDPSESSIRNPNRGKMLSGSSNKFWNEVYKVIDSSHVIIEVLDARDPDGTRCHAIEQFLKNEKPFKNLILVLNKCDLVPTSMVRKWLLVLSRQHPVVAFRATETKSFGKEALMTLLRQFVKLHKIPSGHQLSCGILGYPNVGKSSMINVLRGGDPACKVAPLPGQTKVWQYVKLTQKIYLIDSPGVVRSDHLTDEELVLRAVVRVEHLKHPEKYIDQLLELANKHHLSKIYKILKFNDSNDFLSQVAIKRGRLLKKGMPDTRQIAMSVLRDWQFGKIPHYVKPNDDHVKAAIEDIKKSSKDTADNHSKTINKETKTIEQNKTELNAINSIESYISKVNEISGDQQNPKLPKQSEEDLENLLLNELEDNEVANQAEEDVLAPVEFDIDLTTVDAGENWEMIENKDAESRDIEENQNISEKDINSSKQLNAKHRFSRFITKAKKSTLNEVKTGSDQRMTIKMLKKLERKVKIDNL